MCDWREGGREREKIEGGRQITEKRGGGKEVREADRVELRQMFGIDEARSDADTQAEPQPGELIPSCSLCFLPASSFFFFGWRGGAMKALVFLCVFFFSFFVCAYQKRTHVHSMHFKVSWIFVPLLLTVRIRIILPTSSENLE